MGFARFMASGIGRGVRILAGIVLMIVGWALGGALGVVLALVGLVPLAAGVFNFCVFAPILRVPFNGRKVLQTGV